MFCMRLDSGLQKLSKPWWYPDQVVNSLIWIISITLWLPGTVSMYAQPVQVAINGQTLPSSNWLKAPVMHLPAREKSLVIAIQCQQPDCAFEYRLRQDRSVNWQPFTGHITIHFDNLAGSEYLFQVREPNKKPFIEQRIFVENAVWQSWWFIPSLFVYIIFVVSIIVYFFFRYRYRQQLRLMQVRDRIARDLHDDMGSYLSSISILSQTARRTAEKDPIKTQAALDRIGQTARQVMDSMGDIVWSINPDHDSMDQVIARMTDVASTLFAGEVDQARQVSVQFDVSDEGRQLSLSAESRRDFFLIYKEAITNVAKYAQASRVQIFIRRESSYLTLQIQDNGCGFEPHNPARLNPSGGNGLRNMQNRAALLNGTLRIQSAPAEGTTITLHIPV